MMMATTDQRRDVDIDNVRALSKESIECALLEQERERYMRPSTSQPATATAAVQVQVHVDPQYTVVQHLWKGYGEVRRYRYDVTCTCTATTERLDAEWTGGGSSRPDNSNSKDREPSSSLWCIAKYVCPPPTIDRSTDTFTRKMKSFLVERAWYRADGTTRSSNTSTNNEYLFAAANSFGICCRTPCLIADLSSVGVTGTSRAPTPTEEESKAKGKGKGQQEQEQEQEAETDPEQTVLLLEDLDAAGFNERRVKETIERNDFEKCLRWLAHFHAIFLALRRRPTEGNNNNGQRSAFDEEEKEDQVNDSTASTPLHSHRTHWAGLWGQGNYWYLETRKEEYEHMEPSSPLRLNAQQYESLLNKSQYVSLLHGDAKVANFCFAPADHVDSQPRRRFCSCRSKVDEHTTSTDSDSRGEKLEQCCLKVAALDFQYVGVGTPACDVAYLIANTFVLMTAKGTEPKVTVAEVESYVEQYLCWLAKALRKRLGKEEGTATGTLSSADADDTVSAVMNELKVLFPIAWLDYSRFRCGWLKVPFSNVDPITEHYNRRQQKQQQQ